MKLALFGHGRMGQAVAERARQAGHEVGVVITSRNGARGAQDLTSLVRGHDAAIDFSTAGAVLAHAAACAAASVPLVEGTTGWQGDDAAVRRIITEADGALVVGANFSIGMHVFSRLVARAGELVRGLSDYDAFIEEAHHAGKRDAPSGTALQLKDSLETILNRPVPVASTRAGKIPGTHRVGFDSAADQILLEHTARSRDGFAAGAIVAAQWIVGRRGVFSFEDALKDILP